MTAYIEMISTLLNRIRAMFNATSSCLVSMDAAYSHPSTQHPHWIKHIYHHLNQLGSTDQQCHTCRKQKKTNYFTSSDPHHDMLGGGCQVRVVIKNMMGKMENLRTLISGFLGLVILVRWALVAMFLS